MADDIELRITADDEASKVLEAVADEAEDLAGEEIEVTVEADTEAAQDDVAEVADALEEIPDSVESAVEVDTGSAEADVSGVTDALEDVPDSVAAEVEAETAEAEAAVEGVSSSLENLDGQTATATAEVDTAGAEANLEGLGSKLGELGGMLEKLPGTAGKAGGALGGLGKAAGGPALAAAGMAAAGYAAVQAFTDLASEVRGFQRIVGTTAEESSAFVAVLDDYAISADAGAAAIGKMARTAATAPEKFAEFDVAIARNEDGTIDLEATLLNVAEAYQNTEDQATKAALGAALMGKGYTTLIPILERGADGADGLQEALEGVSGQQILTQKQLDQAEEYRLAMDRLSDAANEVVLLFGSTLVPALTDAANALSFATEQANTLLGPIGGLGEAYKHLLFPLPAAASAVWDLTEGLREEETVLTGLAPLVEDVAQTQEDLAAATDATAVVSDTAAAATDLLSAALGAVADATEAAQQAEEERNDALRAAADATFAVHEAEADWLDSLEELPGKIDAITSSGRTQEQQTRDLQSLMISQVGVAADMADADVKLAEEQATAAGTTLDQAEATRIWNDKMLDAARDAEGPLRDAIVEYIAKVNEIPPERVTEVLATDSGTLEVVEAEANETARDRDATINFGQTGLASISQSLTNLVGQIVAIGGSVGRSAAATERAVATMTPLTINIHAPGGVYGDAGIRQLAAVVTDEVATRLNAGVRFGGGGRP